MRRWRAVVIVLGLLLLAGAVVNVGVAWVLVGAPDSWSPSDERRFVFNSYNSPADPTPRLEAMSRRIGVPPELPAPFAGYVQRGLGWTEMAVVIRTDEFPIWEAIAIEGGWPARSLRGIKRIIAGVAPGPVHLHSLAPPPRLVPGPAWHAGERQRIPLKPIPAGFAMNTLFYAAILALPLTFFPIRRRLRARRGRCPTCGYDRAGLAGAGSEGAAPCPECGATE